MPVTIVGNNTPTAGGVVYGDGTNYASTAAGTSGQPLVSGGSGAPAFRPYTLPAADGTANQVLQTNGSGALSFATPSTGAMVFLSAVTASNSATVDIETTFDSTYDTYVIVGSGIGSNGSQTPTFQVRLKLGGSYITTSTYAYQLNFTSSNSSVLSGSSASSVIYFSSPVSILDSDSSNNFSFVLYINNPSSTSLIKMLNWTGGYKISGAGAGVLVGTGFNSSTSALTGVRFYQDSGNVLRGTFRLYGIKNS